MLQFRAITFNINSPDLSKIDALHHILSTLAADIISLVEADDEDVVIALAKRLDMHHVWARGSGTRNVALLSCFPIVAWEIYNKKPLTQAALRTSIEIDTKLLDVYTIHLIPYAIWPLELRRWQALGKLQQIIRQQPVRPHLIMGDLNCVAPGDGVDIDTILSLTSPSMRRLLFLQRNRYFSWALPRLLKAGYVDCFRQSQPMKHGYSYLIDEKPIARFDYILADPTLASLLTSCDIVTGMPALPATSDHFPFIAEFNW